MLPKSVSVRQRSAYDFESCYISLCALQSTPPLFMVQAHLKDGLLDINGDKVRMIDWSPILNSIKINKSLSHIAIKSFFQASTNSSKKEQYFKRKTPSVCTKDVTVLLASSLSSCISASKALKILDLQGVPLRKKDVYTLAKGIEKNCSLTHISLNYCQIADSGVKILCHALKNHPSITHISMAGCNITALGAELVSEMIKHQGNQRHSEAWVESLRYRTPNLNCMGGIRRIVLNSNPMIGDEGVNAFVEALKDDLWLKALDLQHCGISTEGALNLLSTVQHNKTIVVLDVRNNPMVDRSTLRSLLGRVLLNANENDEADYPWIKEVTPKDPYKTKRYRPSRSVNKTSAKKSCCKLSKQVYASEAKQVQRVGNHKSSVNRKLKLNKSKKKANSSDEGSSEEEAAILCFHDDTTDTSAIPTGDFEILKRTKIDETSLSLKDSHTYIQQLKVDVINSQRRLHAALENEARLNDKMMALEVENRRLKKDLAESFENTRLKSQIDDDVLLDSIEQSFNKFHSFLNMLDDVGLGGLASAAGLDFSLPYEKNKGNIDTKVQKKIENNTSMPVEDPIVIEGGITNSQPTNLLVDERIEKSTEPKSHSNGGDRNKNKAKKEIDKVDDNGENEAEVIEPTAKTSMSSSNDSF